MKYQSLNEIFENLDEDVTDPLQLAKDFDCKVIESELPNHIQGFTEPTSQYIFINRDLNEMFKKFVIAHELVHALLDSGSSYLLENERVSTLKTEARANKGAFFLLLRNYYYVLNIDGFNICNFMNFYHIPEKYFYFFNECLIDLKTFKKK